MSLFKSMKSQWTQLMNMLWNHNKIFVSINVRACIQRSMYQSLNQFIVVSHVLCFIEKQLVFPSQIGFILDYGENFGISLWWLVFCYVRAPVLHNQTYFYKKFYLLFLDYLEHREDSIKDKLPNLNKNLKFKRPLKWNTIETGVYLNFNIILIVTSWFHIVGIIFLTKALNFMMLFFPLSRF